ncbi:class E basic helix-loop-helix protein 40-like [Clytia hemisphaerica]|uniref:BHLH domain-containing protein n=1 Tax=Clytia hemisphaerica TaxID=252671 RepID=A0A7M5V856_9CNID
MTNTENSTTTSESLITCNGASSPVKPVEPLPRKPHDEVIMDSGGLLPPSSENSNLDDIDEDNEGSDQGSSDSALPLSSASNTNNDSSNEENERSNEKKRKDILHRDIEKRRRERINRSLVKLKSLVPTTRDSMKCNGNSRLQKAKLLEMTVEYLENISKKEPSQLSKDCKSESKRGNESPNRDVVVESAKEIYLTGYKAATEHIIKKISDVYNISGNELQSLTKVIGIPEDVKVPNMVLVPPSPSPLANGEKKMVDLNDAMAAQKEKLKREKVNAMTVASQYGLNYTNGSLKEEISMKHSPPLRNGQNAFSFSDHHHQEQKMKSEHEKETDTPGPILLSCLMQDPMTSQYHTTVLPLTAIMSAEKCRNLSMPYLYKQSKNAIETVLSKRKDVPPLTSPKASPNFFMPPHKADEYAHALASSPLKRLHDDRQVPVIIGGKRPPQLTKEYDRSKEYERMNGHMNGYPDPRGPTPDRNRLPSTENSFMERKQRYDINANMEMVKDFDLKYKLRNEDYLRGLPTSNGKDKFWY